MREQQDNRIYKTALYLRLSKDDDGTGESASITTQRSILQEYAKTHGLTVVDEYSDDGYSGTNFNRPEFMRMIADIEAGKINCVLTKDLSRLGRNSARTSDLLDEYFPSHGIRYISAIDGYDSQHLTSGIVMTTPLVMAMHEMYARDISNKIRSSFQAKMEKGEYIASFAPYGYKKSDKDKNKLVVDYQVAHIVQEMFQMAADGLSPGQIAKYFNNKGVATPAVYRCSMRPYLNIDDYSKRKEWTSSMVCKMLRNEVYLGHIAQGKTSKVSFKSKKTQTKPSSEWIRVEHTHEPLITEEVFRLVRNRSTARRNPPTKGFENVFSGIAKCADCGRNMTPSPSRKKGATYNLCCGGYKTYGAAECGNHFIDYDLLYSSVLQELRTWLSMSEEEKNALIKELEQEEAKSQKQRANDSALNSLAKMEERVAEISKLTKRLYEDYAFSRIDAAMYERLTKEYNAELMSLDQTISDVRKLLEPDTSISSAYREFFTLLEEVAAVEVLTKPLLRKLIDRIEIEQGYYSCSANGKRQKQQKIRIFYRFIGCVSEEKTP